MTTHNKTETPSAPQHYIAKFTGRTKGAIGKFYAITAKTSGANKEEAILNLYDRYEHISMPELTPVFGKLETPSATADKGAGRPKLAESAHTPGLQIALAKMRRNIVPDLSMSVIAESYDELLAACKAADEVLTKIANYLGSITQGSDCDTFAARNLVSAAIAKAAGNQ